MYTYRSLTCEEREALITARRERGYPPHQPPHPLRDQTLYLVSAACFEHRHHITCPERRQYLLDQLFQELVRCGIETRAWVVLPNHYHALIDVEDFGDVGEALRRVHGRTSHAWNTEDAARGRRVWYRYSDRAIRSERYYYTTLNYIHYNPCKHGHTTSPYAWPWSSVAWYLEHHGRQWLRDLWRTYPLRAYGKGWDDA